MDSGATLCNGRYVIRGVLGEGAQGTTYDAFDTREGRPVAIKRFDVRGAKSWKDVELAERETRVLATLDHPLVPRYLEHFEENAALYLVMEKIEGETLQAIRQRYGPIPEDEVRRFLACADRAMTYLHGRALPVVHRDVKPRNIVRRPDGSYVFVDFGAVSELLFRRGGSTIVGTFGYMAPEQFQGRASAATDVYAVGATALAALTGVEPDTLGHQGLRIDVRGALNGRASPAMISSLERMLEPDPDRRAKSLAAALDGPHSEPPPGPSGGARAIAAPLGDAKEDAAVKSIRNLLWVLYGLGWIIVPVTLDVVGNKTGDILPIIMFGWLAAMFVISWHKGAMIRAALRLVLGKQLFGQTTVRGETAPRQRVDVGHDRQVRVHTTELRPEELTGQTLRSPTEEQDESARLRRERRS